MDQFKSLTSDIMVERLGFGGLRIDTVILVGWSIANPNCLPPGFEATVGHLQKLQKHMDVDLASLRIWRLRDDDLEPLDFVLRNEHPNRIGNRIVDLAEAGSCPLVEVPKPTLADAYKSLRKAADNPHDAEGLKARQLFEELFQEHFINPLMDEAQAAQDPLVGLSKLQIARLAAEIPDRLLSSLVMRKTKREAAHERDLKDIQAMNDMILKLWKQTQCKTSTNKKPVRFRFPPRKSS